MRIGSVPRKLPIARFALFQARKPGRSRRVGRRAYLSKSKLMAARQCEKRLFLEINAASQAEFSAQTEAAFRTGNEVGALARRLYGVDKGDLVGADGDLGTALAQTRRLMRKSPRRPLFEAAFEYRGVLVRADILLPQEDGWRLVEVKSSTSVKDEHAMDCAIQSWVIRGAGQTLTAVALAHVDNGFVYAGNGDYQGLLVEHDMGDAVRGLEMSVTELVARARQIARGSEPAILVGKHCGEPYDCPFVGYCWPSEPRYPVQCLGGGKIKLAGLIHRGYEDALAVPPDLLSEKQRRIQRVTSSGAAELAPAAADEIAKLEFPRYYLDFETVAPAIPVWPDTRPYETLPIQWSCHLEKSPGEIDHCEFLDLTGVPPMRRLAESLIRALGTTGPVLMYTNYERRVIRALAARFPDLGGALLAIDARLVDLHPIAERHYYHPAMAGSWSLKALLPTISADLDYKKLDGIQEGTAASEGYLEAIRADTSAARKAQLRRQLLDYCRIDTAGMVRLTAHLAGASAA